MAAAPPAGAPPMKTLMKTPMIMPNFAMKKMPMAAPPMLINRPAGGAPGAGAPPVRPLFGSSVKAPTATAPPAAASSAKPSAPAAPRPVAAVAPKPVAKPPAVAQQSAVKPKAAPVAAAAAAPKTVLVRGNMRGGDDDDDEAALLLGGQQKAAAAPVVRKQQPAAAAPPKRAAPAPKPAARKRARSEESSSSSSTSSSSSSSSNSDRNNRDDNRDSDGDDVDRASEYSDPDEMPLFLRAKQAGHVPLTAEEIAALTTEEIVATGPPPRPKTFNIPTGTFEAALERAKVGVQKVLVEATIKDSNKTISLGTSKTNYIDPRIVFSWGAELGVSASKLLNKSLQDKFPWAKNAKNFEF